MIYDHPGQKLKLCLAAHHGNRTPPRIYPSCPFRDRSTNAGAVIARQIGHDLLSGRSDPLPTLFAAFMQRSLHRWIFALPPMSLPILCLYKAHQRMYFSLWICTLQGSVRVFSGLRKSSPHYLSSFRQLLIADSEKLPKTFYKICLCDNLFGKENKPGMHCALYTAHPRLFLSPLRKDNFLCPPF